MFKTYNNYSTARHNLPVVRDKPVGAPACEMILSYIIRWFYVCYAAP